VRAGPAHRRQRERRLAPSEKEAAERAGRDDEVYVVAGRLLVERLDEPAGRADEPPAPRRR